MTEEEAKRVLRSVSSNTCQQDANGSTLRSRWLPLINEQAERFQPIHQSNLLATPLAKACKVERWTTLQTQVSTESMEQAGTVLPRQSLNIVTGR